ncbi:hypothetical protein [Companilactobacillus bobalius]|uniref:Uncharacterized protein n=1 Tax=Companilactobacillus bobalius TaxID=2801451 RepID=A0A202FFR4_9LACO|nr:hypothetical protein [Companilactobacillus bobalius]KAE9560296.1 hypothetical protein ATN92_09000 [Companilactobacillus bobalius]OVE99278.1 hypothetical protein LKACC16343_00390 [Companilactobacillus bobalius]GEO57257.1 hypothetical protein LBO01_03860 [Companilactobacillus paralimentarius]
MGNRLSTKEALKSVDAAKKLISSIGSLGKQNITVYKNGSTVFSGLYTVTVDKYFSYDCTINIMWEDGSDKRPDYKNLDNLHGIYSTGYQKMSFDDANHIFEIIDSSGSIVAIQV